VTYLTIKYDNEIAFLTLNRPQKKNAFNLNFLKELQESVKALAAQNSVRLLIIDGAGENVFSSGVDLSELIKFRTIQDAREFAVQLENTMMELLRFPKPLIAAMNGHALGGGFGLAASADIRIMAAGGKIGFPAARLGAILPIGCTLRVNALAGAGKTRELLLTGRLIDAPDALAMGLINKAVNREDLLAEALNYAEDILKSSDEALRLTKEMVNQQLMVEIAQYTINFPESFAYLAFTDEWKNRIKSFLEK
jgi:enoyl-CoA hydratase